MDANALSADVLHKMDAYWRAANYLSVGQIYLCDNRLIREPLKLSHVKHMLLGHWGTTPGQNFIYVHLNRVIKKYDLNMIGAVGYRCCEGILSGTRRKPRNPNVRSKNYRDISQITTAI